MLQMGLVARRKVGINVAGQVRMVCGVHASSAGRDSMHEGDLDTSVWSLSSGSEQLMTGASHGGRPCHLPHLHGGAVPQLAGAAGVAPDHRHGQRLQAAPLFVW
jgi:hypothetical protein